MRNDDDLNLPDDNVKLRTILGLQDALPGNAGAKENSGVGAQAMTDQSNAAHHNHGLFGPLHNGPFRPGSTSTSSSYAQLPPLPPPPSLPDTMRELRDMEDLLKAKKKLISKLKKDKADPDDKRTARKLLEAQLKELKTQVKKEKDAFKEEGKVKATVKRSREDDDDDDSTAESEDFDILKPAGKRLLTTIDKWQKGHRRAALSAARNKLVEKVTCATWAEGYEKLSEYGWAVVNHWPDLVHPACRPDAEQRDYMLTCTFLPFTRTLTPRNNFSILYSA
jgi:hypothetical protein